MSSFKTIIPRYCFTLDSFATAKNRICVKYFSAAYELEAVGTNFFRQTIDADEFCWVFPHPRLMSACIGHLNDQGAKGVLLLICIPSHVAFARVFAGGQTARFVKTYKELFPTWQGLEEVASTFFKGKAMQRVLTGEFDFSMEGALDMVKTWFLFTVFLRLNFLPVIRFIEGK